jgi:hypothetical protein
VAVPAVVLVGNRAQTERDRISIRFQPPEVVVVVATDSLVRRETMAEAVAEEAQASAPERKLAEVRVLAGKAATAAAEILGQGLHRPILVVAAAVVARVVLAEMPAVLARLKAALLVVLDCRTASLEVRRSTQVVVAVVVTEQVQTARAAAASAAMAETMVPTTPQAEQSTRAAAAAATVLRTPPITAEAAW